MTHRLLILLLLAAMPWRGASADPPNVLFIVVDDMNDWISLLDPTSPIKTPNLERLARRGTLFT
ncbi:MAG: choline-sulfatase, partial [Verrucomicrobiia bacterium]